MPAIGGRSFGGAKNNRTAIHKMWVAFFVIDSLKRGDPLLTFLEGTKTPNKGEAKMIKSLYES
jgi:hypothetical protein